MKRHAKALVAVLVATLTLGASAAFALTTHKGSTDVEAPPDGFAGLAGLVTDPSSHQLYAADSGANRVERFSPSGEFERAWGWGVVAAGPDNVPTNEHQSVTVDATGGTYTLAYEGEPTSDIAFDATAAEVQSALEALSQLGAGNVNVTGPAGGPYDVEFTGAKADIDVSELSADPINLTGNSQSATVATTAPGNGAFEICKAGGADTCQAGIAGNGLGQFNGPQDVTVDSSGDVFVADTNNGRIAAFDSTGAPLASFGTDGLIDGTEAEPGTEDATTAPGFSFLCGLAIDPVNGDLLAADAFNNKIWIYDASGKFQGRVADSSQLNGPCGIALDSGGTLYVRNWFAQDVVAFHRSAARSFDFERVAYRTDNFTPEDGSDDLPEPTDVAVDSSNGHLYVDAGSSIVEYDPFGHVSTFASGTLGFSQALAIDGASEKIYAAEGGGIRTFALPATTLAEVTTGGVSNVGGETATLRGSVDPAGLDTTDCHFEYDTAPYAAGGPSHGTEVECLAGDVIPAAGGGPVEVGAPVTDLAPGTEYHYRLVVENAEGPSYGADKSFSTDGPPLVESLSFEGVGTSTATLEAQINPSGAATTYRFEYTTDADFQANGFAGATKVPVPDGAIGSGSVGVPVQQLATGLSPAIKYDFRVVATNAVETADSVVRSFNTLATPAPAGPGEFPGQGFLPDNRAWEMVSPPEKGGGGLIANSQLTQSSLDGNRVGYGALANFGDTKGTGAVGTTQYVATRHADGWTSHAITPTPNPVIQQQFIGTTQAILSPDLSRAEVTAYDLANVDGDIDEGIQNLYRETFANDLLEPLTTPLAGPVSPFSLSDLSGGSTDFSDMAFTSTANLVGGASGGKRKLYEWEEGTLRLAGVLPGGAISSESNAPEGRSLPRSVSEDGSRVLFTAKSGGNPQLYMRRDHTSTVWVSESEGSAPVASPAVVRYEAGSADLAEVAFTTTSALTDDDPGGEGEALYIYKDSADPEHESNLTFIERSPSSSPPSQGGGIRVWGMSRDGARGLLTDEGELRFWDAAGTQSTSINMGGLWLTSKHGLHERDSQVRVSGDGRSAAFVISNSLNGANDPRELPVLYVYDGRTGELTCASCPPTGGEVESSVWVRAESTEDGIDLKLMPNRFLSQDGSHVFFSTADALVPEDVNGRVDAYEYDVDTHTPHLISSGRSPRDSWFAETSPDGHDAFFVTSEQLSRWDTDTAKDLYDARIDGGMPEPVESSPGCIGDACQPPPSQLNDPTPASSSFRGPANATPRHSARKRCANGASAKRHSKRGQARHCRHGQHRHHRRHSRPSRRAGR